MRDEDRHQLDRVVALVRDVLGPDALGAYLFGSAVLGELRPHSDLDVLVVSSRRTTRAEKLRLGGDLLALSGRTTPSGRWRRVELTVVVESEITPWRYPPTLDFLYGDWLRTEFESGDVEPSPRAKPDLASLITMVLLADAPLFGPAPAAVFDPVPRADLVRAMVGGVDPLLGDLESDTANVILTLARIWSTLVTGDIRSKDAAADWALARLPEEHRAPLAHARAIYLGDEEERWDGLQPRIQAYAECLVAEIRRSDQAIRAALSAGAAMPR
jgi:predicted nucleotidyltransferase